MVVQGLARCVSGIVLAIFHWIAKLLKRSTPSNPKRPAKQTGDSNKREKDAPIPVSELHIPQSLIDRYEADQERSHKLQRRNFVVACLTLGAVVIYAAVTYCLLAETRKANVIAKQNLVVVQRALVLATAIAAEPFGTPATGFIRLRVQWENTGNTPTRGFRSYVNFVTRAEPIPKDYNFPDLDSEGKILKSPIEVHSLVPPKVHNLSLYFHDVPVSLASAIGTHLHLYSWGWAKYRDIFEDSPSHTTRFCFEITHLTTHGVNLTLIAAQCDENNCTDEECDKGGIQKLSLLDTSPRVPASAVREGPG